VTRPFKIAVAGSHSTGKSTFVERLQAAMEPLRLRIGVVHDSAARARDIGFPILSQHTFESTAWLIAEAIRMEAESSLVSDVILVDRPVPDALGYLLAALRHTNRTLEPGRYERLETQCRAWIGEYDLIFVTELDSAVPIGPDRDNDEAFRIGAEKAIHEILDEMAPNRLPLRYGQTDEAIRICLSKLADK
jgi:predicted ATPase